MKIYQHLPQFKLRANLLFKIVEGSKEASYLVEHQNLNDDLFNMIRDLYRRQIPLGIDIISIYLLSRQGHCSRDIRRYCTRPQDFTTINGCKILQTDNSRYISRTKYTISNLEKDL